MKCYRYLIVGNSAAGIGAVEAIREVDGTGSVAIVADEAEHTHSRALIAFYLMGRITRAGMDYRPRDFYRRLGVAAMLGRRVAAVDAPARRAVLADGAELGYERLLLATGGRPIRPRLPGLDLTGVFTFQSVTDAEAVKVALADCRRAVIIGGGLIGMQAAEALVELGCQVTVVELLPRILAPVFDGHASEHITSLFQRHGVEVLTGVAVTEILPQPGGDSSGTGGRVGGVRLSTGTEIPADLVILSVGVVPRTDLAAGAGIPVNKGMLVDATGATGVEGIFAAGDCAEGYDLMLQQTRPLPIWPRAYTGGRIAGLNMAGVPTDSPGDIAMNSSHFFGFAAMSAGIHDPDAPGVPAAEYEILADMRPADGYYKKVVLRDDRIAGLVLMGKAVDRAGILLGLMRAQVPVSEFRDRLLERTTLISLPDALRRQRLTGGRRHA